MKEGGGALQATALTHHVGKDKEGADGDLLCSSNPENAAVSMDNGSRDLDEESAPAHERLKEKNLADDDPSAPPGECPGLKCDRLLQAEVKSQECLPKLSLPQPEEANARTEEPSSEITAVSVCENAHIPESSDRTLIEESQVDERTSQDASSSEADEISVAYDSLSQEAQGRGNREDQKDAVSIHFGEVVERPLLSTEGDKCTSAEERLVSNTEKCVSNVEPLLLLDEALTKSAEDQVSGTPNLGNFKESLGNVLQGVQGPKLTEEEEDSRLEDCASASDADSKAKEMEDDGSSSVREDRLLRDEEDESPVLTRNEESATCTEESVNINFEDDTLGSILSADVLKDDEDCPTKSDACETAGGESVSQTKDKLLSDVTEEEADTEVNINVAKDEESSVHEEHSKGKDGDGTVEELEKSNEERVSLQHDFFVDDGLSLESVSETSFTLNDNTEENEIGKEGFSLKDSLGENTQDSTGEKERVDYKKDFLAELEDISSEDNEDFFADIEPVSMESDKAKGALLLEVNENSLFKKEVSEGSLIEKQSEESLAVLEDSGASRKVVSVDENEVSAGAKAAFLLEGNEDTLVGVEAISSDDNEDTVSEKDAVSSQAKESFMSVLPQEVATDELLREARDDSIAVQGSVNMEDTTVAEKEKASDKDGVAQIEQIGAGGAIKPDLLEREGLLEDKTVFTESSAEFVCRAEENRQTVATEERAIEACEENSSQSAGQPGTEEGVVPEPTLPIVTKPLLDRESFLNDDAVDNLEEPIQERLSPVVTSPSEGSAFLTADENTEAVMDAAEDNSLAGTNDNISVETDEQRSQSTFSTASNDDAKVFGSKETDGVLFSDISSPTVTQHDVDDEKEITYPALPLQEEDSSTLPSAVEESCALPCEAVDNMTLPSDVEDNSAVRCYAEDSSAQPSDAEDSSAIPCDAEDRSTLPSDAEESSATPCDATDSSADTQGSAVLPAEVNESSVPLSELQGSAALLPETEVSPEGTSELAPVVQLSAVPSEIKESPAMSSEAESLPSESKRSLALEAEVEEFVAVPSEVKEQLQSPLSTPSEVSSASPSVVGEIPAVPSDIGKSLAVVSEVKENLAVPTEVEESSAMPSEVGESLAESCEVEKSLGVVPGVEENVVLPPEVVECLALPSEVEKCLAAPSEEAEFLAVPSEEEESLAVSSGEQNLAEPSEVEGCLAVASDEESLAVPSESDDLAVPSGSDDLAVPSEGDDLAVPSEGDDLAVPSEGDDFAVPSEDDLPVPPEVPIAESVALTPTVEEKAELPPELVAERQELSSALGECLERAPDADESLASHPSVEEGCDSTPEAPERQGVESSPAVEESLASTPAGQEDSTIATAAEDSSNAVEENLTSPAVVKACLASPAVVEESATSPAAIEGSAASPASVEGSLASPIATTENLASPAAVEESLASPAAVEQSVVSPAAVEQSVVSPAALEERSVLPAALEEIPVTPAALEEISVTPAALEEISVTPAAVEERSVSPAALEERSVSPAALEERSVSPSALEERSVSPAALEERSLSLAALEERSVSPAVLEERSVTPAALEDRSVTPAALEDRSVTPAALEERSVSLAALEERSVSPAALEESSVSRAVLEESSVSRAAVEERLALQAAVEGSATSLPAGEESSALPSNVDEGHVLSSEVDESAALPLVAEEVSASRPAVEESSAFPSDVEGSSLPQQPARNESATSVSEMGAEVRPSTGEAPLAEVVSQPIQVFSKAPEKEERPAVEDPGTGNTFSEEADKETVGGTDEVVSESVTCETAEESGQEFNERTVSNVAVDSVEKVTSKSVKKERCLVEGELHLESLKQEELDIPSEPLDEDDIDAPDDLLDKDDSSYMKMEETAERETDSYEESDLVIDEGEDPALPEDPELLKSEAIKVSLGSEVSIKLVPTKVTSELKTRKKEIQSVSIIPKENLLKMSESLKRSLKAQSLVRTIAPTPAKSSTKAPKHPQKAPVPDLTPLQTDVVKTTKTAARGKSGSLLKSSEQNATVKSLLKAPSPTGPSGNWPKGKTAPRGSDDFRPFPSLPKDTVVIPTYYVPEQDKSQANSSQPMNLSTSNEMPIISKSIPATQPLPANVVPSRRQRAPKTATSRGPSSKNAPVPPPMPIGAMMPNMDPNMFPSMWSLFGPQLLSSQFLAAAAGASGTLPPFPMDPQKQNLLGAMLASSTMPRLPMPPSPELNMYNTALMQMQVQMDAFLPPPLQEQMQNSPIPPDMNRYNAALMQMQAQMDAYMPPQMGMPPGGVPMPPPVPPCAKGKATTPAKPQTKPQATILPQPKVPPQSVVQQANVVNTAVDLKQPAVARKPGGRNTKFTPGSSPRLVKRPTSAAATAAAATLKIPVPAVSAAPRLLSASTASPPAPAPVASTPPAPSASTPPIPPPPATSKKFKVGSKLNSVVDKLLAGAGKQGSAVDLSATAPKSLSPVPARRDTPPLKEAAPVKKVIQVTNALTIELDSRERRVRPPMPALLPCKHTDPPPNPCEVLVVDDAKKARGAAVNGCVSDVGTDAPQVLTPEQARRRHELSATADDDAMSVTCSLPLDKVTVMFDAAKKSPAPSCGGLPTLPPTLAAGGLEILPMEVASCATSTPKQVVPAPPIGANSISLGSNVSLTLTPTAVSLDETPLEEMSAIERSSPVVEEDPTPSPPQLEAVSSPLKRPSGIQDGETSSPDKEVPSLDLEVPEGLDSPQTVQEETARESAPAEPAKEVANRKKFSFAAHSSFMMTLSDGQKLFTCDICSGVYQRAFSLKRHYLRSHINYIHLHERDISNCGIIVGNKMAVQTEPNTKVCLKDSKITVVNTDEEGEEAKNAPSQDETNELGLPGLYRCFTCGVCFDLKDQLRNHLQEHKPTGDPDEESPKEKLFTCEICAYPFRHKKNYLRHLDVCQKRKLSSDQSEWLCLFCNKTFQSAAVRSRHLSCIHKRIRPGLKKSRRSKVQKHTCVYCGTVGPKFNDLNSLLKHMITSHEDVYFGCLLCEERYPSKSALEEHTNVTHNQDAASSEVVPETSSPETPVEGATPEDATSGNLASADSPLAEAAPETAVPVVEPERVVPVGVLPREPKAASKKSDAFQFVCSVCKKMFVSEMNMKRHKQLAHGGPRGKKKRRAGNAAQPPAVAAVPEPNSRRKEPEKHDPEALFYSRLSMQIRENLMHHLDGKLDSQELFEREEQEPLVVKNEATPKPNPAVVPQQPPDVVDIHKVKNIPRRRSSDSYLRLTWDKFNINKDKDNSVSSFIRDMSHIDIATQLIMRRNMKRLSEKDSSKCIQSTGDAHRLEYPFCIALVQSTEGARSLESATPESLTGSMLSVTTRVDGEEPSCSTAPIPPPKVPLLPAEDFLNGPWKNRDLSNEVVELSGEWVRPKYYLCAACDSACVENLYEMEDHLYQMHPNVWGTYWEFEESTLIPFTAAGIKSPSSLYQRSLKPTGSLISAPEHPANHSKDLACTKCSRVNHSLPELHRHMLDCGGDTTWHLTMILTSPINGRRNRKWRPFGSRRRRQQGRRGLKRNIPNTPQRPKTNQPKTRGGDAETIQRMIANLPAKRSTRRVIQFKEDEVKTRSQATMASVQFPVSQSPLHKASRAILGRSMATSSSKPGHMPRARPLRTSSTVAAPTTSTAATSGATPEATPAASPAVTPAATAAAGSTTKKVESSPKAQPEPEVAHTMVQVQTLIPAKVKKAVLKLAKAAEGASKSPKEKSPNTAMEALPSTSKKAMSLEGIPESVLGGKASPGKGEKTTDVILEAMRKAMMSTNGHMCSACGRMFNNSGNRDRHFRVCSTQAEEGMPRLRKEASAPRSRQTSKNADIPVLSPNATVSSADVETAKSGESQEEPSVGADQSSSGKKKKKRTIVGIRKSLVKSEEVGGGMVVTESFLVRVDSSSNELSEPETKDKAEDDLLDDVFESKGGETPSSKKKESKKKGAKRSKVEAVAVVEAPVEDLKKTKKKKVIRDEEVPVKKLTRSKQASPQKVPVIRVDRSANPEIIVSGVQVAVPGTVDSKSEGLPTDVEPDNLDFEELLDIMDAEEVKQLDMIVAEAPSSDADDDIPLGEKIPIWKKQAEDQSPLKSKKGTKRRAVDVVLPPAKKTRRSSILAEELVEAIEVDDEESTPKKSRSVAAKGRKKSLPDAPTLMLPPTLIPELSPKGGAKNRRRSSVIRVDASPVVPADVTGVVEELKTESVPVKGKKKKAKPVNNAADVIDTVVVVGQSSAGKKTKASKQDDSLTESESEASDITPVSKKKSKGAKVVEEDLLELVEEVEADEVEPAEVVSQVSAGKKKTKTSKQGDSWTESESEASDVTTVSKKKSKKSKVVETVEAGIAEEVKPALKRKSKGAAAVAEEGVLAELVSAEVPTVSKKKSKAAKLAEMIPAEVSLADEPKSPPKKKSKVSKTTDNTEATAGDVLKVKPVPKRKSKGAAKPVENVVMPEPQMEAEAALADVPASPAVLTPALTPTSKKKSKAAAVKAAEAAPEQPSEAVPQAEAPVEAPVVTTLSTPVSKKKSKAAAAKAVENVAPEVLTETEAEPAVEVPAVLTPASTPISKKKSKAAAGKAAAIASEPVTEKEDAPPTAPIEDSVESGVPISAPTTASKKKSKAAAAKATENVVLETVLQAEAVPAEALIEVPVTPSSTPTSKKKTKAAAAKAADNVEAPELLTETETASPIEVPAVLTPASTPVSKRKSKAAAARAAESIVAPEPQPEAVPQAEAVPGKVPAAPAVATLSAVSKKKSKAAATKSAETVSELELEDSGAPAPTPKKKSKVVPKTSEAEDEINSGVAATKKKSKGSPKLANKVIEPDPNLVGELTPRNRKRIQPLEGETKKPRAKSSDKLENPASPAVVTADVPTSPPATTKKGKVAEETPATTTTKEATAVKDPADQPVKRKWKKRAPNEPVDDPTKEVDGPIEGSNEKVNRKRPRSSCGEDGAKLPGKGRVKKKAKLELDESLDSPTAEAPVPDETPEKAKTVKKKEVVKTGEEELVEPGMPAQVAVKPKKKSKAKVSVEPMQVSDDALRKESTTAVDQVKSSEFAVAPTPSMPMDPPAANSPTPGEQPDVTPKKRKSSIGSQFFCDLCQRHYSTAYNLTKHLSSLSHRALLRGTQTSDMVAVSDDGKSSKSEASPAAQKTEAVVESVQPFLEIAKDPVKNLTLADNVGTSSSVDDKAESAYSGNEVANQIEPPLVQTDILVQEKQIGEPVPEVTPQVGPQETGQEVAQEVLQQGVGLPDSLTAPKEAEQVEEKTPVPEFTPLAPVPEYEGTLPVPNPVQASLVQPQDQNQYQQRYPTPLQEIHHQRYSQVQTYSEQQYNCYETRNWQGGDSGWGPWRIPDAADEMSNNVGFGLGSILDSVNQVLAGDGGGSSDLPDSLYAGYALNEIQNAVGATDEEMAVLRQLGEGSFEELVGAPGSVMWPPTEETQLLDLDNQRPNQPPESEKAVAETALTPLTSRKRPKSPAPSTSGTVTPSKTPNNTEAIPSTSSRDDTRSPVSMLPRPKTMPAGGNSLNELYEDRQMWCPSCHRRFLGLQAMKAHMAQHHSQNQRVERKATLSAEGSSEHRIICEVCREMVVDQVALELHMEELHSGHNDSSKAVPASPSPGAKSRVLRMQMSHALGGLLDRALKNYLSKATTGAASSVDTDRSRFTLGLLNKLALRHQANSASQRDSPRATPNPSETDGDAASSHSGSTTPTNLAPKRRNSRTEPMFVQYQGHPCPYCPEKFMSDAFVKRHINNVHANLIAPETSEDNLSDTESRATSPMEFCADPVVGDDGAFLCSSCGINFKSPSEVLEHQRAQHQPTLEEIAQSGADEERVKAETPVMMRVSDIPDPKADDDVDFAEIAEKVSEFQQRVANPLKGRSLLTKDLKNKKIALAVESAMLEHTAEVQLVAEAALRELGPCRKSSKSSTKESPKWGIDAVKFTVAKEPALVGAYGPVSEQESRLRNIPIVRKTSSSAPRFSFAERKKFARPATEVKPGKEKMEIYEFDESPKVEPLTLDLKREVEDVPEKTQKAETLSKEVEVVESEREVCEVLAEVKPDEESPDKSESEVTPKVVAKKKQIPTKKKDTLAKEEGSVAKPAKMEKKKIFKKRKSDQESGTPKSDESAGRARKQRRASTHDATDYSVFDFSSDESSMGAAVDVSREASGTPTSPRARRENASPPKKATPSRVQELLEEDWTWLDDSESEKEKRKKMARRKRTKKKEKCGDSPKKPAAPRESRDTSDRDTSEEMSKKAEEGSGLASGNKRRKRSETASGAGGSGEAAR